MYFDATILGGMATGMGGMISKMNKNKPQNPSQSQRSNERIVIYQDTRLKQAYNDLRKEYEVLQEDYDALLKQNNSTIDPDESLIWCYIGDSFNSKREWKKAVKALLIATQFDPQNREAWHNLAHSFNNLSDYGNMEKAKDMAYSPPGTPNPFSPLLNYRILAGNLTWDEWLQKTNALSHFGRYEEATESIYHAIILRPDHFVGYVILAMILEKIERYSEALAVLNKANELPQRYQIVDELIDRISKKSKRIPK